MLIYLWAQFTAVDSKSTLILHSLIYLLASAQEIAQ